MSDAIRLAVEARLPEAVSLLSELIGLETLSGREEPAVRLMADSFARLGYDHALQSIPESIKQDPDYSGVDLNLDYEGRHNIIVRLPGPGGGRSAILQTHLDVVPATDWKEAFSPRIDGDAVYGRGACDCKGQAATLWLVLAAIKDVGMRLAGDVTVQFVIEEEIGGNGALAAILAGDRADAAVILEPTSLNVHPACRGALWFRITLQGHSVHMGRKQVGVSAFEKAVHVFNALEAYEQRLVEESRGQPLFEKYENPVQVNVGVVRAGEWPSMVPGDCEIEGGVGFLPNKPMRAVQEELRSLLAESDDPWITRHSRIEFPKLHNDAYAIDPAHPSVQTLASACRAEGLESEVCGWNVSCDARLYALRGKMPAVVFGPGDVSDAHSDHEQICGSDMAKAASTLAGFLIDWCGVA